MARHGAKATFFVIGKKAAECPDLVRAIVTAGHEVAHHTHTPPAATFWCAGPRRIDSELDAPQAALTAAAGVRPTRFRAPVGIKNVFVEPALSARDLVRIPWSLRSWDSLRRDPRSMVDDLMARFSPGAIILLHEGLRLTRAIRQCGLVDLLAALKQPGYRCVLPSHDQLRR